MRQQNIDQARGDLYFNKAQVLMADYVRIPAAAPALLKNKGALAKAGEYLASKTEPKKQFTALIKTLIRNPSVKENYRLTYRAKYFIWTWTDDEVIADDGYNNSLERFLRTEAVGMCRHTRMNCQLKALQTDDATKRLQTKGVCPAQECSLLSLADLFKTYMNERIDESDRNARFVSFLQRGTLCNKGLEVYTLVDSDDKSLKVDGGKFWVSGISTKTFRWTGNSNGLKCHSFSLQRHANSRVEGFKNTVVRGLTLQAKRASTRRDFICLQFAHEDKDSLYGWQKAISDCLKSMDDNEILLDEHSVSWGEMKRAEDQIAVSKLMDPTNLNLSSEMIHDLVITGEPGRDAGSDFEEVTGHFYTSAPVSALFKHIVPLVNENDQHEYQRRFDRYVFGSTASSGGYEIANFGACQTFVDPPMEHGGHSELYGVDKQSILVRAQKQEKIEFPNWVSQKLPESLRGGVFDWIASKLAEVGLGDTNEKDQYQVVVLSRKFNLKKTFYSPNAPSEGMNAFGVSFESVPEESDFDDSLTKLPSGVEANLAELSLKFEQVSDDKKEKEVFRTRVFEHMQKLLHKQHALGVNADPRTKRNTLLKMCDLTYETVKDSRDLDVISKAFSLFVSLAKIKPSQLMTSQASDSEPKFAAICDVHVYALYSFLKSVQYLVASDRIENFGNLVVRQAFEVPKALLTDTGNVVSTAALNLIDRLGDVVEFMRKELELQSTKNIMEVKTHMMIREQLSALKGQYEKHKELRNVAVAAVRMRTREEALSKLKNMSGFKTQNSAVAGALQGIKIPYVVQTENGVKWAEATVNADGRTVTIQKDLVSFSSASSTGYPGVERLNDVISLSISEFEKASASAIMKCVPEFARDRVVIDPFYKFSLGQEYWSNFNIYGGDNVQSGKVAAQRVFEKSAELLNSGNAKMDLQMVMEDLQTLEKCFSSMEDKYTKVSFYINAKATDLFGEDLCRKVPLLATNWMESMIKDIVYGVRHMNDDRILGAPESLRKKLELSNFLEKSDIISLQMVMRPKPMQMEPPKIFSTPSKGGAATDFSLGEVLTAGEAAMTV